MNEYLDVAALTKEKQKRSEKTHTSPASAQQALYSPPPPNPYVDPQTLANTKELIALAVAPYFHRWAPPLSPAPGFI